MARIRVPWMLDLMAACQEIAWGDVAVLRAEGAPVPGGAVAEVLAEGAPVPEAAVAEASADPALVTEAAVAEPSLGTHQADKMLQALAWTTGLKDHSILVGLAGALPHAVLEEQTRAYQESLALPQAPKTASEAPTILVYPHLLKSRMQVAAAFDAYLLRQGWVKGTRVPNKACTEFIRARLIWSKGAWRSAKREAATVRR